MLLVDIDDDDDEHDYENEETELLLNEYVNGLGLLKTNNKTMSSSADVYYINRQRPDDNKSNPVPIKTFNNNNVRTTLTVTDADGCGTFFDSDPSVSERNRINSGVKRVLTKPLVGNYLDDGESTVDFVLAYIDGQSQQLDRQRHYYVQNLQRHGLIVEEDSHRGEDHVHGKLLFMKVHARWHTLCRVAELLRMKLPLRNADLLEKTSTIDKCIPFWDRYTAFNEHEQNLIGPDLLHVTAQFTRATADQFLIENRAHFFTQTQKIRIVYDVLQHAKCDPDNPKKRGLQWLIKKEVFLAAYPPHDGGTDFGHLDITKRQDWSCRQILRYVWADFKRSFKPQPLHFIRSYFGDKVGFYFAWLGFYTRMLVFPSFIGVLCFLYGIISLPYSAIQQDICDGTSSPGNLTMCPVCRIPNCDPWQMSTSCDSAKWNYRFDQPANIFMSVFTLSWAIVFNKMWKRKEDDLIHKWDGQDDELDDIPRPEFETRTSFVRISPVTNQEEAYIPTSKKFLWLVQSFFSLVIIILMVVAGLVALIVVRIVLYGILKSFGGIWFQLQFDFASLAIHVLTFIVVMTLGYIYEKSARRLTELECPRTENGYLTSYVWKVFIFELLNNFAPIFYASFIRGKTLTTPSGQSWLQEMCDPGGCLNEVVQACGILLLARLLISNAAELGVPVLKSIWNNTRLGHNIKPEKDSEVNRDVPRWQKDFTLNDTDLDGVYMEYLETMVQFGYVVLFVAAFPLAPLICLLNNILEIRLDAINFVTAYRRPLPARATSEHIWQRCLNIIIKLGILSNGGFLAFTSEVIPAMVYQYKYSKNVSQKGYVEFSLTKFNTSEWIEFKNMYPEITQCYYKNFAKESSSDDEQCTQVWSDIMLARLCFFIVFVLSFYLFQWLCDFWIPDLPASTKTRMERANFLSKKAIVKNQIARSKKHPKSPSRGSSIARNLEKHYSLPPSSNNNPNKPFIVSNGGLTNNMFVEDITPETLL